MASRTGNFTSLTTPGLRKVYFSTVAGIPKEFRQIVNVIGPDAGGQAGKNFFEDQQVASIGTFAPKGEGQTIQYDDPIEGNSVRYTPYSFGLGVRITEEMQDDDLYGVMSKITRELAQAAAHQLEVQGHRPINGAFSSTGGGTGFTPAGFSTKALIATDHVLIGGGTYGNRATVDSDLSVTALENATDIMEETPNERDMPHPMSANLLVVPPQLKWIAKELTESELKPYTGNNEINPLGGEGFRYIVDHYLTDPDSWYLFAPKSQHDVNVWVRKAPDLKTGDDFDTGDMKMKGVFRVASGHGDWRGVYGSQGA